MAKRIVTDKEFERFKERVAFWAEKLGAAEWRIVIDRKKSNGHAEYTVYDSTHVIAITLASHVDEREDFNLDKIAFHEIFEAVYFADLRWMSRLSYNDHEVEKATHRAVCRAENFIRTAMLEAFNVVD